MNSFNAFAAGVCSMGAFVCFLGGNLFLGLLNVGFACINFVIGKE